jgi:hypothetical protein
VLIIGSLCNNLFQKPLVVGLAEVRLAQQLFPRSNVGCGDQDDALVVHLAFRKEAVEAVRRELFFRVLNDQFGIVSACWAASVYVPIIAHDKASALASGYEVMCILRRAQRVDAKTLILCNKNGTSFSLIPPCSALIYDLTAEI